MKLKHSALILFLLSGVMLSRADDDDDDSHQHDDDDDDGQPHYCPKDNGMFPNPTDCSTFYNCVDGQAIAMTCAPGLLFDPETKMCNFPGQVKCKNECQGPNGLFPSQHRCDEFVLCTNNKPKVMRCKKGLYFDSNLQVCNYKGQVLCNLPGKKKKKGDKGKKDKDKATKIIIKYVDSGKSRGANSGEDDGHKKLAAASVKSVCPKARGLFAHAENCKTFYQCYDGEVLMKSCPAGLLFDEYKHTCAYESEVDCGHRRVFRDPHGPSAPRSS